MIRSFCFLILLVFKLSNVTGKSDQILIVVSYDAFRNEYFDRNVTNYMNELRFNNTYSDYMRNVFPTKTFPNHHSIATGVFTDEHGVMANELFDRQLNKTLEYSFELYHYKSEIKPIWTLNELNGGTSGCLMWPGSNFDYEEVKCTYTQQFSDKISFIERVDTLIKWITDPTNPANLVMFYIEEPDKYAHAFGVTSEKVTDFVKQISIVTEYLHHKLMENGLLNRTSVVHVSDHGMADLKIGNIIDLTNYVGNGTCKFYGTTPVLQVVPEKGQDLNAIYNKLQNASKENKHFKVYLNDDLPKRWNYENKLRTGPITVVADIDYGFQDMFASIEYYKKSFNVTVTNSSRFGVHGYDNANDLMHPIFFAYGNQIKTNNKVKPFDSVDLYYLFCEILKLPTPGYLKGNKNNILGILRPRSKRTRRLIILLCSLALAAVLVAFFMWLFQYLKRRRDPGVPSYIYEETDTILDEQKLNTTNYSVNSQMTSIMSASNPSTSTEAQVTFENNMRF